MASDHNLIHVQGVWMPLLKKLPGMWSQGVRHLSSHQTDPGDGSSLLVHISWFRTSKHFRQTSPTPGQSLYPSNPVQSPRCWNIKTNQSTFNKSNWCELFLQGVLFSLNNPHNSKENLSLNLACDNRLEKFHCYLFQTKFQLLGKTMMMITFI